MLGRELAPFGLGDHRAGGDGQQRIVRLVVGAGREEGLVGGHQRHAAAIGIVDQLGLVGLLLRPAVALELDIEPVAEERAQGLEPLLGLPIEAGGEVGIDRALRGRR